MSTLRLITKREPWRSSSHPNNAADSVKVTLECGCQKNYKGSKVPHSRARCNCNYGDWGYCIQGNRPGPAGDYYLENIGTHGTFHCRDTECSLTFDSRVEARRFLKLELPTQYADFDVVPQTKKPKKGRRVKRK